ncbi:MAG TPA: cupin domain-containing protein [Bacteroidota bacterium]|nr:cupin domain-containing protein [Bacteroidota bacterium]
MADQYPYATNLDIKFEHFDKIDLPEIVRQCKDRWFNQTLTKVNDSVVRVGIVQGEYHWHKHDAVDEFFFVLQGKLLIDLEDRTIELSPNQGVTISRGVMHRPRAPEKTVMLMVETSSIQPTGN